ncbi:MAG: TRAP transporter substrate-binding protein [Burkholderiales bacterium]
MNKTMAWASAFAAAAMLAGPALADGLPKTNVKVIGYFSVLAQTKRVERPFWTEKITKDSGGMITADYNNLDVLGVNDFQILHMTQLGVTDFAASDISKMAGEDPVFEGCDLAGITNDLDTARKACEAWKPVMAEHMKAKFNTGLMLLAPNPPIVFWCRDKITGLADLKGKKVRVFNKTQTDFVSAIGGETVTMPFPSVVPALQRGVVDCALTGTLSGNTAGWPEVSKYLFPLTVGWSIAYQGSNLESWGKFPAPVQDFFIHEFGQLENDLWTIGAQATEEGVNCNTGKGSCTLGKPGHMTLVHISKADQARTKELVQNVVLVKWGKRCGKACAEQWNQTVGKVVHLSIPLEKL